MNEENNLDIDIDIDSWGNDKTKVNEQKVKESIKKSNPIQKSDEPQKERKAREPKPNNDKEIKDSITKLELKLDEMNHRIEELTSINREQESLKIESALCLKQLFKSMKNLIWNNKFTTRKDQAELILRYFNIDIEQILE